jgi:hypothetical protein
MAELGQPPRHLKCQQCDMALVLLPRSLYPRAADWDTAQLAKFAGEIRYPGGDVVAMYTVPDANGNYACPACGTGGSV